MKADLHVHSTASDGTLAPRDLVALALERGLCVLAIADHDSVEGLSEAAEAAHGTPLTLVPAVELSANANGRDVHILGYFIRPDDEQLREHLTDLRAARLRRARTMVDALTAAGLTVGIDDVLRLSDGGAVGRSHIARALVSRGHAETVADAFQRLIGRERPFYVAKDVRMPSQAIACIREAGGIAVVAHPGISDADDLLGSMIEAGLRGIEAYHADHTPEQRDHYAKIAADFGLLTTGGSDFHGPAAPNPMLGSVRIPFEAIDALLAAGEDLRA